jgi:hypothetical protein
MNYNATYASVSDYRTGRMQDIPDRLGSVRGLTRRGFHRIAVVTRPPLLRSDQIQVVAEFLNGPRDGARRGIPADMNIQ